MIDVSLLRENPSKIIELLQRKDASFDAHLFLALDKEVRELRTMVESLRHTKNELAQQGKTGVTQELRARSTQIGKELKEKESRLHDIEKEYKNLLLRCPNIPYEDLPKGGKESNLVVREYGVKPSFDFPINNHVELGQKLGWFDFEAAARMTGSNFVLYKGEAVKLMYSLIMFMLKHNEKYGYSFVLPPYLVNEKSLENASNFPKFREQVYEMPADNLFLIPTAEVNLANMYRDTTFQSDQLPLRMTAWTSCFRREAGTYGAAERGLIRIHQFEKVELYTYCQPEESNKELEMMIACAESLLQKLGLHYRVSLLAAQDCSFPSAKTFDIEVWMPGQNAYYEVSSCSNCTDFQSRRGGMRYRKFAGDKSHFVHTLNGSALALPRLIVALMETYQQPDGSIKIPEVLKGYGFY